MDFNRSRTQWNDWKWQISQGCRDLNMLREWIAAKAPEMTFHGDSLAPVLDAYQMGITPYYFDLIQKFDHTDPIYNQIVPSPKELDIQPKELDDPIGDEDPARGSRPLKALLHRYQDRVLLFPTALCAVYCRYCFRKRLVGQTAHNAREEDLSDAFDYIQAHPEISEVILTGGDPLTLGDRQIMGILHSLEGIKHVRTVRIHTRLPVVNPYRLTQSLGTQIVGLQTPVWISTHFNHANELTPAAIDAIQGWINMGIPFLNQSVLLQGVNNEFSAMKALLLALISAKIKPYYLHHADLVKGTAHLRVSIPEGLKLMKQLRGTLPGYAIPHYIFDRPGGHGKIPLENQVDLNHPEVW